jgi:hypothetical protein
MKRAIITRCLNRSGWHRDWGLHNRSEEHAEDAL